jgi:23S rRNA (uracil1939-C5)-methyltransferase
VSPSEVTIEVSGLAHGGDCVGTVVDAESANKGKKMFLPFTVPGETVEASITKEEKNLLKGTLLNIIKSSESRVVPPCKLFGNCGGCDYQHIEINAQRKFKEEMVLSMLKKHGGLSAGEVISQGSSLPSYHYRNRITMHLNQNSELGFYKKNSGDVVDCDYCHISSEALNVALGKIRNYREGLSEKIAAIVLEDFQSKIYLVLKLREEFNDFSADELPQGLINDFPYLEIESRDENIYSSIEDNYPAGHFSQVNEKGNSELIDIVLSNTQGEHVLDLYAGDGNFSIPLAKLGKRVLAVEIDPDLTQYAVNKVKNEGLEGRVEFTSISCEKYFKHNSSFGSVILDPPRSGAKNILLGLNNPVTVEIIYVSCSLPSFCRDVKEICSYGFKLEKLYIVDMFPQTHHVETIGVLRR